MQHIAMQAPGKMLQVATELYNFLNCYWKIKTLFKFPYYEAQMKLMSMFFLPENKMKEASDSNQNYFFFER